MSPAESGETEPTKPVVLGRSTLVPVTFIAGAVLLAASALTTAVFGHETRLTVLEANTKNDRESSNATDERIEKLLDELKADVKKLLEKP